MVDCAGCIIRCCSKGEECGRGQDLKAYDAPTRKELEKAENKKLFEVAACVEGEHYMEWTRLEEICGFAEQMGYTRIGLTHCIGLTNEAKYLKDVLEKKGFLVESIRCKFSGIDKRDFNLNSN